MKIEGGTASSQQRQAPPAGYSPNQHVYPSAQPAYPPVHAGYPPNLIGFNASAYPGSPRLRYGAPSGLREYVNGLFWLRECVKIEKKLRECVN